MTAKEYLSQIEKQTAIINNLNNEIKRLLENAKTVSAPNYSAELSSYGNTLDIIEKYQMKDSSIDLSLKLYETRIKADRKRCEIIGEIHQLDNANYIKLLYKRYAEFKNFRIIAKEMNYDENYVRDIHAKALKEFEKVLTKSYIDMCYNGTVEN